MNKALLLALLLTASAGYAMADESTEAPSEVVTQYTQMCVNWAKDDEVVNEDLYAYVLQCVNDELISDGYKPVTSIKL